MLAQPTQEQLTELRLFALDRAWQAQNEDPTTDDLGFDERLALLVDAEWTDRQNKRLVRLLREAKLRISGACLEDSVLGDRERGDRTSWPTAPGGRHPPLSRYPDA
jgi:hypothetical protein